MTHLSKVFAPILLLAALAGCTSGPEKDVGRSPELVAPAGTVKLIAVGDIMMGTTFPDESYLNPRLVKGADLASIIGSRLLGVLRSGDIVFGNMEGSLYDGDGESKECKNPKLCYVFRSPEFHAELLKDMGFNMMSVANNHSGDFLEVGRNATMAALARNGIIYAGLDMPGARTGSMTLKDGTKVGLAAFAPNRGTLQINDIDRAARIVGALAADHDIVVVSFHGGAEGADNTHVPRTEEMFYGERRGDVYAFSHRMIDAGADVVIGHGPHVVRAVEVYKNRFIAYSLGNFWTYGRFNISGLSGVAPVVDLRLAKDGRLLSARLHSVRMAGRGVPRLDDAGQASRAVSELTAQDFPEARLTFADDGTISGPGIGAAPLVSGRGSLKGQTKIRPAS